MQNDNGNQDPKIIKEQNKQLFMEGKAKIYTKYIQKNQKGELVQNGVFYNPVQIFNRDFTILVMQTYINKLKKQRQKFEGVNIIDALSASGLRTIRFLRQLQGVKIVYANDISPASHKLMKDNFVLNDLNQKKYKMTLEDANLLLLNLKKDIMFDIIDLDPYGSGVPFLQSSIQAIRDGGLMCLTCTDTKVTCGPDISKCYYYYGSTRAKVHHFNQNALRIVLNTISSTASRHCKYIQPLISFQTNFYLRVFLIVRRGKKQCAQSGTKLGNIYNCNSCGNYQYSSHLIQKPNKPGVFVPNRVFASSTICKVCQQQYYLNGPVWLGKLNDFQFVKTMKQMMESQSFSLQLQTHKKIYGNLHAILEQKQLSEIPLGFNFDLMCKKIKAATPSRKVLFSSLQSLGYKIAPSYISPGLYKTNASFDVIYDVIKSYKLKNIGQQKYLSNVKEEFSLNILNKKIQNKPDFQFEVEKQKKVPRFISMGKNMGPKGKPESRILKEEQIQKIQNNNFEN